MLPLKKGFTLTEMVVVVLMVGIGIGLFNSVFINNWSYYDDQIKRAQLWTEATQLFEQMSFEGRNAKSIDTVATGVSKVATFTNAANAADDSTFTISNTGTITWTKGGATKTFSTHAVFANSNFRKISASDKNILVELQLQDLVFMRNLTITASTEVLTRN